MDTYEWVTSHTWVITPRVREIHLWHICIYICIHIYVWGSHVSYMSKSRHELVRVMYDIYAYIYIHVYIRMSESRLIHERVTQWDREIHVWHICIYICTYIYTYKGVTSHAWASHTMSSRESRMMYMHIYIHTYIRMSESRLMYERVTPWVRERYMSNSYVRLSESRLMHERVMPHGYVEMKCVSSQGRITSHMSESRPI